MLNENFVAWQEWRALSFLGFVDAYAKVGQFPDPYSSVRSRHVAPLQLALQPRFSLPVDPAGINKLLGSECSHQRRDQL